MDVNEELFGVRTYTLIVHYIENIPMRGNDILPTTCLFEHFSHRRRRRRSFVQRSALSTFIHHRSWSVRRRH